MENSKLIKFLIPIFVLGFFIVQADGVFAYEIETHAFLTDEVIKFYNQSFSNQQIPDELRDYLIDGSRREDDPPRWMNHFYDPVYNRGLTDSALGDWQKSKDWARDGDNQTKLKYSPTIATILSSWQSGKIQKYFPTSDFTWKEAIRYWIQGNKEMAMFTLGHVLHLLEDASLPDCLLAGFSRGFSLPILLLDGPFLAVCGEFTESTRVKNYILSAIADRMY